MRYEWIDEYLLSKKGVTKDLQESWNWIRYHIGGKMFAAICLGEDDKPYYINLKLEPVEGDFWRSQYKDIIPGYYSNKKHWNSIDPDGEVPDDLLRNLLDKSYRLVFNGLTKKKQKEIIEGIPCPLAHRLFRTFQSRIFIPGGGKACHHGAAFLVEHKPG